MHAQLNIALTAAREGARHLGRQIDRLDRVKLFEREAGRTRTSAHMEVDHALLYHLQKMNPRHGFQSTVTGQSGDPASDIQWLVDPLYGCDNFLRNTPGFGVAVACQVKNRLAHAALIDPLLNEEYFASAGNGASLGSRRLRVTGATSLESALVTVGLTACPEDAEPLQALLAKLFEAQAVMRCSGSPVKDILDTAAGRFEAGRVRREESNAMSAAQLVLREAGGLISDETGNPDPVGDWLVFGNPKCFRQLLKLQG